VLEGTILQERLSPFPRGSFEEAIVHGQCIDS